MALRHSSSASALLAAATLGLFAQGPAETLPIVTRIEVLQNNVWRRGNVSEDKGPGSPTMKVRLEPDNAFNIVPRKTVRVVPHATNLKPGDRVEWNGSTDTSFRYVPATVKELGTGTWQGYASVAADEYPKREKYTKFENLWVLPASSTQTAAAPAAGPNSGNYRCRAGNLNLATIDLKSDGTYTPGVGAPGAWRMDPATSSIVWLSGWAKTENFGGKLDGNAMFRLTRALYCSHE